MSALEEEIIKKFRQLAPEKRAAMLSTLQEEVSSQQVSLSAWLAEAETIRFTLRPDANGHAPTASEMVNEAREERDADIIRSLGLGDSTGDSSN